MAAKDWADNGAVRIQEIQSEAMNSALLLQKLEWIGYGLTVFGFLGWWVKIQRYQDGILRLDYETAKLTFEKDHPEALSSLRQVWWKRPISHMFGLLSSK